MLDSDWQIASNPDRRAVGIPPKIQNRRHLLRAQAFQTRQCFLPGNKHCCLVLVVTNDIGPNYTVC